MRALILLITFSMLFSCAPENKEPQVRFVNQQGKSRDLAMRYPEKNLEALNKKPPTSTNSNYSDAVVNSVDEMVINAGASKNKDAIDVKQEIISYDLAQDRVSPNFPPKKTEVVEYDLASEQAAEEVSEEPEQEVKIKEKEEVEVKQVFVTNDIKKSKKSQEKQEVGKTAKSGNYFVQIGAFSMDANAKQALTDLKKYDPGMVKKVATNNKTLYKAWLGPYSSKSEATKMAAKIKASGKAAIVVKN